MKRLLMMGLVCVLVAGCEDTADSLQRDAAWRVAINSNNRYQVERVAVFRDDLAYNEKRGIYVIKDTETGREYVGISGIGIVEQGMHSTGKTTRQDER